MSDRTPEPSKESTEKNAAAQNPSAPPSGSDEQASEDHSLSGLELILYAGLVLAGFTLPLFLGWSGLALFILIAAIWALNYFTNPIPMYGVPMLGKRIRFRLVHCIYALTLIAALLGLFGIFGIFLAFFLLVGWVVAFWGESRKRNFLCIALPMFVLAGLCSGLVPHVGTAREAARRMACAGHFKQLALALHNYHDTYGTFPPAYIADETGKPMHSWRVLILPFLEEKTLYGKYRFDEPWDGPNNRSLATRIPEVYKCPSQQGRTGWTPSSTNCVAIVGDRTAWPGLTGRKLEEIADGTSNSLLVIESNIPLNNWMEPIDVRDVEAIEMLSHPGPVPLLHFADTFFYISHEGRNTCLADGSIPHLPVGLSASLANSLVYIDDGEPVGEWEKELWGRNGKRYAYGNIFRLIMLIVIIVFPTPWVWLGRSKNERTEPPVGESLRDSQSQSRSDT